MPPSTRWTNYETVKWDLGAGNVAFDWIPDADRRSPCYGGSRSIPGWRRFTGGRLRLSTSELLRK